MSDNTKQIIAKFKEWTKDKDADYMYDQIHDFVGLLSRGELLSLFLELVK